MTSAALSAAGRLLPRAASAPAAHWRRRLIVMALMTVALAAAYMLWFRDSSFVRVERVEVVGLAIAPDAARLETELTAAAERMTTLHLDREKLEAIAAKSPAVQAIALRPDFPHGLTIRVVENQPVAILASAEGRLPVAADGTVLEGVEVAVALPEVATTAGIPASGRLSAGGALDRVEVAAAAPRTLREQLAGITIQPEKGYVAELREGPVVWLGGHDRLADKWAAAAAILAHESSAGAEYVDVRTPERAVAGGLVVETDPLSEAAPVLPEGAPADPAAAAAPEAAPDAAAAPAVAAQTDPATAATNPQPALEP